MWSRSKNGEPSLLSFTQVLSTVRITEPQAETGKTFTA